MKLEKLLNGIEYEIIKGSTETDVTSVSYDTRKAVKGCAFVCIHGAVKDSHDMIPEIIWNGASAIIIERELCDIDGFCDLLEMKCCEKLTVIKVNNSRKALAYMAAAFFGNPAERLITIGITGTKGKTTTSYMVKDILDRAGIPTGLIGTVEVIIGDETVKASNTTPESYAVQQYFKRMADKGLKAVVMEVSSQGLMQGRVDGFTFDYGIFTNLEPDHIGENEHKDFEDYMYWKSTLFTKCKKGIFNCDSEFLEGILKEHTCSVTTFGINNKADYRADKISFSEKDGKLLTSYHVTGKLDMDVKLNVPGIFSVYNSLCAIAICNDFNVPAECMTKALKEVHVKGRTEIVDVSEKLPNGPGFTVMIDYAHNAMALESLLVTLKEYKPGRLVCLFGCGGNRAKSRRYEMGEVASRLADFTIITSDNPRFEDPEAIIEDILTGFKKNDGKYIAIPDRQEAVNYAIKNAEMGDVIVLCGKGHEDYQEIKGVKHHMEEKELIDNAVSALNGEKR